MKSKKKNSKSFEIRESELLEIERFAKESFIRCKELYDRYNPSKSISDSDNARVVG